MERESSKAKTTHKMFLCWNIHSVWLRAHYISGVGARAKKKHLHIIPWMFRRRGAGRVWEWGAMGDDEEKRRKGQKWRRSKKSTVALSPRLLASPRLILQLHRCGKKWTGGSKSPECIHHIAFNSPVGWDRCSWRRSRERETHTPGFSSKSHWSLQPWELKPHRRRRPPLKSVGRGTQARLKESVWNQILFTLNLSGEETVSFSKCVQKYWLPLENEPFFLFLKFFFLYIFSLCLSSILTLDFAI